MKLFKNKFNIITLIIVLLSNNIYGQDIKKIYLESKDSLTQTKKLNTKKIQIIGLKDSTFWEIKDIYVFNDSIKFHSTASIRNEIINKKFKFEKYNYVNKYIDTTITVHIDYISYFGIRKLSRKHYYATIRHLQNNAMNYTFIPILTFIGGIVILIGGDAATAGTLFLVGGGILSIAIIKGYIISRLKYIDLENDWEIKLNKNENRNIKYK